MTTKSTSTGIWTTYDSTQLGRIVCLDPARRKGRFAEGSLADRRHRSRFPLLDHSPMARSMSRMIRRSSTPSTPPPGKSNIKSGLGTIGKASLVYADGKLYYPEANGRVWILKPGEKKFEVLSHVDLEEKKGREYTIFGSVAIANGHVYLAASNTTYCIGPKDFAEQNVAIPEGPKEEPCLRAISRAAGAGAGYAVRRSAASGRENSIHGPRV